jgi:hypothetical protein
MFGPLTETVASSQVLLLSTGLGFGNGTCSGDVKLMFRRMSDSCPQQGGGRVTDGNVPTNDQIFDGPLPTKVWLDPFVPKTGAELLFKTIVPAKGLIDTSTSITVLACAQLATNKLKASTARVVKANRNFIGVPPSGPRAESRRYCAPNHELF